MMRIRFGTVLLLAAALFFGSVPASAQNATVYTLAVVPTFPPLATHMRWSPFIERLAKDTGFEFRLKVYETMADFERDIVSPNGPDFLFANALQVVVAHKTHGYLPLVRGNRMVRAVLFVRKDSPATTIDDLAGKSIAFVGAKNL